MQLTADPVLKFNTFLPLYNWIYPIGGRPSTRLRGDRASLVFDELEPSKSRALYIHVPFCETICTFCPFVRAAEHDEGVVDAYVCALVREIELKGRIAALTAVPVGAVFFGGGTPSFLKPEQILAIGRALRLSFDLSRCREFSFEFEIKSVTPDRIDAALAIGVTHARFGAQTFSPAFRKLFNLTPSVDELRSAAALLKSKFVHVSCDMLFGMHGQSEEELVADVEGACALGLPNLDFYLINNLVTQPRLARDLRLAGRKPTSGLTKFYMAMFVRRLLRSHGYLPHNGHGYVRVDSEELSKALVVTDSYSFVYHEHTLGYPKHDLLGFGVNALSSFAGYTVANEDSRDTYVRRVLSDELPVVVSEHPPEVDVCRTLALALPYHGRISKAWIDLDSVPQRQSERLRQLVAHELVVDERDHYALTATGLDWYTNIMFYLLPQSEQAALTQVMREADSDPRREIESSGLQDYQFHGSLPLVREDRR